MLEGDPRLFQAPPPSLPLSPGVFMPQFLTVLSLLLAITIGAATSYAAPAALQIAKGEPADVDMDPAELARALSVVRHAVADEEIPGAVVLVARHGRVVMHEAIGHRGANPKGSPLPLKPDSLFRMASNSKALTAAGIMLLVDEGKLNLDDPVGRALPEFDNEAWRKVTLRHLLTHTSGSRIKSLFLRPLLEKSEEHPNAPDLLLEVNRFAAIAPEHPPGATYSYNNAGYNMLAGVIEKISGSYQDHLRSRIYEPLGMQDSCNHESKADHGRMSTVMQRQSDGSWKAGWTPGDPPDWPFPRGSGGMVTTAWDYAIFCQMLLNQGVYNGKQILSADAVAEMTNPQSAHAKAATTYGLGWKVESPGGVYSHTGSDGTYVWVDPKHDVIGMVLTQTTGATRPREVFRQLATAACNGVELEKLAANQRVPDGYYKDIFMSGGKNLTSRKRLYAAESLGLSYEYYAGADALRQNQLLIGNGADENGALLYPDGSPRFRMIYVNGGSATKHGLSLTELGRERLRNFYAAGGSYCGSCAGSFLSGRNVDGRSDPREGYLHIFPFNTLNTGIKKTRLEHAIPTDSPLLRYRDFGGDNRVSEVYHNNGNWLQAPAGSSESEQAQSSMKDVEVLAAYDHPGHKIDRGAAIWAYRAEKQAGRILNIGCHPEGVADGERLELTEACFLYALDGVGPPRRKALLKLGESRDMDQRSSDGKPDYAKIGDRQYHHFSFDVPVGEPAGADRETTIRLVSDEDVDLHLFVSKTSLAFRKHADVVDVRPGANKVLTRSLSPGRWHVSVFCATSVDTINDPVAGFHRHVGDRSILNGAAYQITVE